MPRRLCLSRDTQSIRDTRCFRLSRRSHANRSQSTGAVVPRYPTTARRHFRCFRDRSPIYKAQFQGIAQWPNERPLPQVFFDPAALDLVYSEKRACLHAKAVRGGVVDSRSVFISSANFTEAAQQRNVEVGVLAHSESLAHRLTAFFDKGLSEGIFHPAFASATPRADGL